ncbi:MAG: efflux RND transporter permease subunit [Candidatus Eremiobacteraeota bacterium]|nr:efflux RND transporter permease subunit [Candidatus Eremiobacteraeota bacterium]
MTRFAINQPTVVTLFFAAIALFGIIGYFTMGVNIYPNVQFPAVSVTAAYPGASPEEIERLIVRPIEDQLQSVRHVNKIRARAQEGAGFVTVEFKLGTNVDFAASDVQQAVDAARANLPSDLDPPVIEKEDPSLAPIMVEALTSSTLSPVALSNLVQNEVIPALRGVKGTGAVTAGGEFAREVDINPDLGRLQAAGVTLTDVTQAIGQGNVSLPGGRLDSPTQEATVGVRADVTDPAQIAQLPLNASGGSSNGLKVGDVAAVVDTHADHRIASTVNGASAIVLNVTHDSDSDTARTTAAVRSEFQALARKYPDVHFGELYADADFLHESTNGVLQNLLEGVLLTAAVLLLFLHVWRSAVVVMIAIPASLLATFFVMWMLGFSIDLLSLMGLSLTIGILVDDSIVVIENITRHRELGEGPEEAAIIGRSEIGGAAVAITLVDVVVFTPIAFMGGVVGQFLREYGLVIVVATLFSLLVSFTLTPLLAAKWAVARKPRASGWRVVRSFTAWFESLRRGYHDGLLPKALRHPWFVGIGSLMLVMGAVALPATGLIPFEFQPNTEYGTAIISLTYPVGTPIATTTAGADRLATALQKMDGVRDVVVTVGQDNNDVTGGYVASVTANLQKNRRHEEHTIIEAVAKLGYLVPGARIEAGGGQNGGGPDISYSLSGPTDQLDAAAAKLVSFIAKLPKTTNVKSTSSVVGPRLEITVDRERAALLGVSPGAAALTARAAIGGVIATKLRMPEGLVDAIVRLPAAARNDVHNLQNTVVRSSTGQGVPLADVAKFAWIKEPPILRRQDRQRIVRVYANMVDSAPIGPVDKRVHEALAQPNFLPAGVNVTPEGDADVMGDATQKIGLALLISFVLIYMLLVVLYRNYVTPLVIMMSIPVALVGALGILALSNALHGVFPGVRYFAGQTLNIFSMLGIVMLMGLVAKNGILLVDYANTLGARGMPVAEAIRESASIRFRPIMMTTAAMIMGMLPLALGFTEGAEFRKSMGTVIIGGLASSLLLTLFLVPVMYKAIVGGLDRRRERRLAARAEFDDVGLEELEPGSKPEAGELTKV